MPVPAPSGVKKISVGEKGQLYMVTPQKDIYTDSGEVAERCWKETEQIVEAGNDFIQEIRDAIAAKKAEAERAAKEEAE